MEERGTGFTGQALVSGGLAPAGSTATVHGLASQYTVDRISTSIARIVFFVLGITMVVRDSRVVQFGALALAVTLSVTQSLVGRPSPFTVLRAIGAGTDGRIR